MEGKVGYILKSLRRDFRLNRLKRNSNPGGLKKQKKWSNRPRRNGREDFRKCRMKKRKRSKNWQSFKKRSELHTRFANYLIFFVTLCFCLYFLLLFLCFVFFAFDILCIRKLRRCYTLCPRKTSLGSGDCTLRFFKLLLL